MPAGASGAGQGVAAVAPRARAGSHAGDTEAQGGTEGQTSGPELAHVGQPPDTHVGAPYPRHRPGRWMGTGRVAGRVTPAVPGDPRWGQWRGWPREWPARTWVGGPGGPLSCSILGRAGAPLGAAGCGWAPASAAGVGRTGPPRTSPNQSPRRGFAWNPLASPPSPGSRGSPGLLRTFSTARGLWGTAPIAEPRLGHLHDAAKSPQGSPPPPWP